MYHKKNEDITWLWNDFFKFTRNYFFARKPTSQSFPVNLLPNCNIFFGTVVNPFRRNFHMRSVSISQGDDLGKRQAETGNLRRIIDEKSFTLRIRFKKRTRPSIMFSLVHIFSDM